MSRSEISSPEELLKLLRMPFMVETVADNLGLDPRQVDDLLAELAGDKSDQGNSAPEGSGADGYVLYTDGASRNNPGHAAGGAVLYDDTGEKLAEDCRYFSPSLTNNAAEYRALLLGLNLVPDDCPLLTICMDSELIVRQLQGKYSVNSANLRPYYEQVQERLDELGDVEIQFKAIPREKNSEADALANRALDRRL
jgi:ribonuclease HI